MSQTTDDREITPNARYDAVYGTDHAGLDPDSKRMNHLREETQAEATVLRNVESEIQKYVGDGDALDVAETPEREYHALTWDDISVTEDPQVLASICAYFSGVSAGEDVDAIRRKLRSGKVEWYANVFLLAKGILEPNSDSGREREPEPEEEL